MIKPNSNFLNSMISEAQKHISIDYIYMGLISLIVLVIMLIANIYLSRRNNKVAKLRLEILELSGLYWRDRAIHYKCHTHFIALPSYARMLFSVKPLKMEKWLSREHVAELEPYLKNNREWL